MEFIVSRTIMLEVVEAFSLLFFFGDISDFPSNPSFRHEFEGVQQKGGGGVFEKKNHVVTSEISTCRYSKKICVRRIDNICVSFA